MTNFIGIKLQWRHKINKEFKLLINEVRGNLLFFQEKINQDEKAGVAFETLKSNYYSSVQQNLEKLFREADRIASVFSSEEHLIHRDFTRDKLAALLWKAPSVEHILKKPYGYAGDFESMNMIYDPDPFKGPTAYFRMINACACRCVSGIATANRVPYFLEKFDKLGKEAIDHRKLFRVLDIACGPAQEIYDFVSKNPLSSQSEFHLLDQDKHALQFAQPRLIHLSESLGRSTKYFFYNKPIKELFIEEVRVWPDFDLIYSSGLFDYLDDGLFVMALAFLIPLLAPGGQLIIGNMSPEDYSKTIKWYIADWPLIFRSREDLLKLSSDLPPSVKVGIESDKTGVNLFLVVQKKIS